MGRSENDQQIGVTVNSHFIENFEATYINVGEGSDAVYCVYVYNTYKNSHTHKYSYTNTYKPVQVMRVMWVVGRARVDPTG